MPKVAPVRHQETLDSLRRTRRRLYAIPEAELSAMSLDDQAEYGTALSKVTVAILNLETMKLRNVNEAFKARESDLNAASKALENDLAELEFFNEIVRVASEGINAITDIVKLAA